MSKKNLITIIVIIIVVIITATLLWFFVFSGYQNTPKQQSEVKTTISYEQKLNDANQQINQLLDKGDAESIKQAGSIADNLIKEADSNQDKAQVNSGDSGSSIDSFSAEAQVSKANLLIQTDRAQEALDTILLPLEKEYINQDDTRVKIDGSISFAYNWLGNVEKSNEYFSKIPSHGVN